MFLLNYKYKTGERYEQQKWRRATTTTKTPKDWKLNETVEINSVRTHISVTIDWALKTNDLYICISVKKNLMAEMLVFKVADPRNAVSSAKC